MDNTQFREQLKEKIAGVEARLADFASLTKEETEDLKAQKEMLSSALKIMTYGTGPERRRFRRDYERRLGR